MASGSFRRRPFGQMVLVIAAVGMGLAAAGATAGECPVGPLWVYARGDGSRIFGEYEYAVTTGCPAAVLDFKDVRSDQVSAYRLPNGYAALRIDNGDVVVIRLHSQRGPTRAVGVLCVKLADGRQWLARRGHEDIPYKGDALDHVEQVRQLPALNLSGMKLAEADLVRLKQFPNLHTLDLSKTNLTDADLKHLAALPRLRRLALVGTQVTEAGVEELRRAMPQLRILR